MWSARIRDFDSHLGPAHRWLAECLFGTSTYRAQKRSQNQKGLSLREEVFVVESRRWRLLGQQDTSGGRR